MAGHLTKFKQEEPFAGIDRAKFLEFLDQYSAVDSQVSEAVAARRDLRSKIKSSGIPLMAIDRVRRDARVSGAERERIARWHGQGLAWMLLPLGFQASIFENKDPDVADLKVADNQGAEAAQNGRQRDANPYPVASEMYQRWDTAYLRGQGERRSDPPKRRGRPRKDGSPAQARSKPALEVHEGGPLAAASEGETRH